ncbi:MULTISPECIES: hypothetical protein [Streptomyces]|uniref:JmjC domain-containing protein n=1 Tax=Streptomyces xinghaiensis TaxID=1038928 RepID=A0A3M8EVS0_9ACTN|nr:MULTISPECIES: hypothetical protein [Streptomyces]OFA48465.1 hypothetical protein BEN35_18730 [Streptomyces fradiae]PQM20092.1 hypothetical protein Sfr7A_28420 [Streptomyces xinghaiensis]RKM96016.1 hypothetical protein SFRA_013595 [Streptomyces xinghaiensis]RNC69973.1 hypothetical protein DC095_027480 [Streptomyces xinghaiensis]
MPTPFPATDDEPVAFWKEFADRHWERRPLCLPESPIQLMIGEAELLRALVRAADGTDRHRKAGMPRIVVTVDGRTQPIDVRPFLPSSADGSLDEYLTRVDEAARGHDWSVAVSGLHAVSAPMWDRAKRLSDDVHRYTGSRVAGRVDMDTFIGRYAATNVGVHVDHAGNFGFTVRGRKTLLTWPPDLAAQVPQHTADYAPARHLSAPLVGTPGALTYFPSPYLHVGESPDVVSVNVNIAFFTRDDPAAPVLGAVGELLSRARTRPRTPGGPTPEAPELPGHAAHGIPDGAASVLRALTRLSHAELADAVWDRSMRSLTSGGLGVGRPAEPPVAVPRDARVRLRQDVVMRQRPLADRRRAITAQGHVLRVAEHPRVASAVAALEAGETVDLAQWERGADAEAVPLLHAVLLRLSTWRATEAVGASGADRAERVEPTR